MKHSRLVCLIAAGLALTGSAFVFAQNPPLQKGVSVHMIASNNATPMPDADRLDAWVVAVMATGQIYFGTHAVTAQQLFEEMNAIPRNRDAKLYIKADARAPFASVRRTLEAAKALRFEDVVLLTKQPETPAVGLMMPPQGFDVSLTATSDAVQVGISNSGQTIPDLKVNDSPVSVANLENALNQALQNRTQKVVVVTADPQLPFSDAVHVIDAVRAVGAEPVLPAPEL